MSAAATLLQTNPFPGLRPFREEEEYLFFGRENQVDAMVDKLASTRFLAVVGTSGSGKSSLVNCGLLPALRQGLMASAGTAWRVAQFRPGSDPIRAMASALAKDGVLFREHAATALPLAEIVETTLRMSKLGLIDIVEQAALGEGAKLLVVADQFEELFRFRQPGAARRGDAQGISQEAAAFVNLLLEVKERPGCPIFIVLTMRSDFLGDCTQFPGLAEAINAGQYLVPRMTRDERRAAISKPAAVGGATIAPVLLTRLVNDVGDNPDQLSILQHALNRTWARWQDEGGKGPLDLAHYEAIGTMANALDQHAEKVYAELTTPRQRQICEKIFKALTDKATDPRGIRRPTARGTLCAVAGATAAEVTEVIEVFRQPSSSFLMPPAGEALEAKTVIDISHESLMRIWQRLDAWATEERRSAWTYRRLADTATLHAAGKAGLWRDPDLASAREWQVREAPNAAWAARYEGDFDLAMSYLAASTAEAARVAREKAEAWARERRLNRRLRQATALTAVLAVASFAAFGYAMYHREKAEEKARIAQSRRLAAAAEEIVSTDSELGLLLALHAIVAVEGVKEFVPAPQESLNRVLQVVDRKLTLPRFGVGVAAGAFDATGEHLAGADRDGLVRVWNVGASRPRAELCLADAAGKWKGNAPCGLLTSVVAFSGDGSTVVAGTNDGRLAIARPLLANDGARVKVDLERRHGEAVTAVALSHDGSRLVSADHGGTMTLWTLGPAGLVRVANLAGHKAAVSALALDPQGRRLVSGSWDGSARSWDLNACANGACGPVRVIKHGKGAVTAVALGPGEQPFAASAGPDVQAQVWSFNAGRDARVLDRAVATLAFGPDPAAPRLVLGSADGTVRVFDPRAGTLVRELVDDSERSGAPVRAHRGQVTAAQFVGVGKLLATASSDSTVKLWELASGRLVRVLRGHRDWVSALAIDPIGARIASMSDDRRIFVWRTPGAEPAMQRDREWHRDVAVVKSKGQRLVAAISDGGVRLMWLDPKGLLSREHLVIEDAQVREIAFDANAETLSTRGDEGSLREYYLDRGALLQRARTFAYRDLTAAECEQYKLLDQCALPAGWLEGR